MNCNSIAQQALIEFLMKIKTNIKYNNQLKKPIYLPVEFRLRLSKIKSVLEMNMFGFR